MTKSNAATTIGNPLRGALPAAHAGHKRRVPPAPGLGCYAWDLTEIDGADDLHDADGILADAMARTAALYGARRCWYLVGGSTVGLLAASAHWHRSAARSLRRATATRPSTTRLSWGQLTARWLTPPVDPQFGIYGSVRPRRCGRRAGRCARRPLRDPDQPDL